MIFISFRRQIGRDDVLGIEEYLNAHKEFDEVYIVHKETLSDVVQKMIEERRYKTVQTDFLRKSLKELKSKGKNKTFFLDEFGKRKLRNPCGRTLAQPQYW